jgi:hypothetical protein
MWNDTIKLFAKGNFKHQIVYSRAVRACALCYRPVSEDILDRKDESRSFTIGFR